MLLSWSQYVYSLTETVWACRLDDISSEGYGVQFRDELDVRVNNLTETVWAC